MQNASTTTSGTIITATGHSGRLRSCSMTSSTTIDNGRTVMQSSKPPIRSQSLISSLEVRKNIGMYHT